jgi:hypothetical protein
MMAWYIFLLFVNDIFPSLNSFVDAAWIPRLPSAGFEICVAFSPKVYGADHCLYIYMLESCKLSQSVHQH